MRPSGRLASRASSRSSSTTSSLVQAAAPTVCSKTCQLSIVAQIFWHAIFAWLRARQTGSMVQLPRSNTSRFEGIRVELAKRIKEHRERLGMSQGELAKAVFTEHHLELGDGSNVPRRAEPAPPEQYLWREHRCAGKGGFA